jgi:hypothetical protein
MPHHLLHQVFSEYHYFLSVETQTTRVRGKACVFDFLTELFSELFGQMRSRQGTRGARICGIDKWGIVVLNISVYVCVCAWKT